MKKYSIAILFAVSIFSANLHAEKKSDFGRDNVLIGADPALMKLMSAVAAKVSTKKLKGEPEIKLRYAKTALKLLCLGADSEYPDLVATTRDMTAEEFERCQRNAVGSIIKFKIGYEALVVVANKKKPIELTIDEQKLFQAIASDVPDQKKNLVGVLTTNPYRTWKDIDPDAPALPIKIFGPAEKSRNERTVKMLGMEPGCRSWDWIPEMKNIQKTYRLYRQICWVPRKDGAYIKAKSDTVDLTRSILSDKNSIGLIDFNSWMKAKDKLKAYPINELPPTLGTISKGLYPLSRTYYVYIKTASLKNVQGLSHFMNELVNEKTLGADGYLADIGMIAMPEKEMKREITQASEFVAMTAPEASK